MNISILNGICPMCYCDFECKLDANDTDDCTVDTNLPDHSVELVDC